MAKNKQQLARFRVIDRELRKNTRVKTSRLVEIIKWEFDIPVVQRTIQEDIKVMQSDSTLGFNAPIEYDKKAKAYYYSDPNFTITAFNLKEEEIKALSFYASILGVYRESGILNHFTAAIDKVIDATRIQETARNRQLVDSMIFTDRQPPLLGSEFIPQIIMALEEQRVLRIEYCKDFDFCKYREHELHPYILRSYENRWYIVGMLVGKNKFTTFGLDRIKNLELQEQTFSKNAVDVPAYYKHVIGITVPDDEPVEVVLSFTATQGRYIKSLPLHPTQEILCDTDDELRIALHVKIAYELEAKILGFGDSVMVIAPSSLADRIKERHLNAAQKYF